MFELAGHNQFEAWVAGVFTGYVGKCIHSLLPKPSKAVPVSVKPGSQDMGFLTPWKGDKPKAQQKEMSVVEKAQSNSLWSFNKSVTSEAMERGKSIEIEQQSFTEDGTPFRQTMRIR